MKYVFLISGLLLFLYTNNALAFRCGNEIVSRFDNGASAQTKCGNPIRYDSGIENVKGTMQYVQKQFFNCGENDFIYSISIYNGIIIKIDSVERGTGKGQCQ